MADGRDWCCETLERWGSCDDDCWRHHRRLVTPEDGPVRQELRAWAKATGRDPDTIG